MTFELTEREKFVVWYTVMLTTPNENLDRNSKNRILRCAEIGIAGEQLDQEKLENGDKDELARYEQNREQLRALTDPVYKELDKMMDVLLACYGSRHDPKKARRKLNE